MSQQVDLGCASSGQDLVNKVSELLGTVLHLVKTIDDWHAVHLTIAQREHAEAFQLKAWGHVQPVVDTVQGQAVHHDEGKRMVCGRLAVPVVPASGAALDQGREFSSSSGGSSNKSVTFHGRKRVALNNGQRDRGQRDGSRSQRLGKIHGRKGMGGVRGGGEERKKAIEAQSG